MSTNWILIILAVWITGLTFVVADMATEQKIVSDKEQMYDKLVVEAQTAYCEVDSKLAQTQIDLVTLKDSTKHLQSQLGSNNYQVQIAKEQINAIRLLLGALMEKKEVIDGRLQILNAGYSNCE